jgi:hypothetical protein
MTRYRPIIGATLPGWVLIPVLVILTISVIVRWIFWALVDVGEWVLYHVDDMLRGDDNE